MSTTAQRLLRFAIGGALLFAIARGTGLDAGAPAPLRVEVPVGADAAAIAVAIDEALLLELAEQANWPRVDAIVRARLLALLGAVDGLGDDPERALADAVEAGLHRRDPIARRRLVLAARRALAAGASPTSWPGALLAAYASDAARHGSAVRTAFAQVFVSCTRPGEPCARRAERLAARLEGAAADAAPADADPWPWTRPGIAYGNARLDALFGAGFGEALAAAPIGRWSGPIRSAFGLHLVFVQARADAAPRSLVEVMPRVLASLDEQRRARATDEALATRRRARAIEVVTVP